MIVTSDNGPWFQGSPGDVRGRKNDTLEGGMRVPFLARWPGVIPGERRSDAVAAAVDLFPTILGQAGVPLPDDRVLDGGDLVPALAGTGPAPDRPVLYFAGNDLRAVRDGRFKWFARQGVSAGPYFGIGMMFQRGPWLFDLETDPDESYDVSTVHPEVFERLSERAAAVEEAHAENPRGWH